MQMKIVPVKKATAGGRVAGRNVQREIGYQDSAILSRIKIPKIILGQALLFGNRKNPRFWPAFEALLRRAT